MELPSAPGGGVNQYSYPRQQFGTSNEVEELTLNYLLPGMYQKKIYPLALGEMHKNVFCNTVVWEI